MNSEARYFSIERRGASGVMIASLRNGRFQFDGEAHAFEASIDEFCVACREQYDGCVVREVTAEIRAVEQMIGHGSHYRRLSLAEATGRTA